MILSFTFMKMIFLFSSFVNLVAKGTLDEHHWACFQMTLNIFLSYLFTAFIRTSALLDYALIWMIIDKCFVTNQWIFIWTSFLDALELLLIGHSHNYFMQVSVTFILLACWTGGIITFRNRWNTLSAKHDIALLTIFRLKHSLLTNVTSIFIWHFKLWVNSFVHYLSTFLLCKN